VRSAAAFLLLPLLPTAAQASGIVREETDQKRFASRAACEKALEARYSATAGRVAALEPEERRRRTVEPPFRDDEGRLSYYEVLDNSIATGDMTMASSETDEYSCRGRVLEHRYYLEGGSFVFAPPPPPTPPLPPAPEPRQP
jgi:hypothetical protein